MSKYDQRYFVTQRGGSRASARRVVPHLLELVRPGSVVDIGCGTGQWLAVFTEQGVADATGLDGEWISGSQMAIPAERFRATDLSRPFSMPRTFDLAISLEVAEHLPAESADTFVDSIAALAPVVAFGAAVPLQGGTGHINEQWPSYWAGRFAARGFVPADALRPRIWSDDGVEWWYRQNTIIYVRRDRLDADPALREGVARTDTRMLDLVHPILLEERNRRPMRRWAPAAEVAAWLRAARRAVKSS